MFHMMPLPQCYFPPCSNCCLELTPNRQNQILSAVNPVRRTQTGGFSGFSPPPVPAKIQNLRILHLPLGYFVENSVVHHIPKSQDWQIDWDFTQTSGHNFFLREETQNGRCLCSFGVVWAHTAGVLWSCNLPGPMSPQLAWLWVHNST